jgi:hypothetical protein
MISLSFNVRGVGGAHKLLALKRLIRSHNADKILIQEMMVYGSRACDAFEPWLRGWSFCTLDVEGLLGGLLIAWSPMF